MFGVGKRRRGGAPKRVQQLAIPLFLGPSAPSLARVVEQWDALFPGVPPLQVRSEQATVTSFEAGGASLMCVYRPVPLSSDEASESVRTSWMWTGDAAELEGHRAHAVVTAAGTDDVVADAWNVTRLSACLLRAGPGLALYWSNGHQVHRPEVVVEFAADPQTPPVPLWVGVSLQENVAGGLSSAMTHGLEALGHREFEVLDTRMDSAELRETLLELALHVLDQGPVLQHGRTFGPSQDVRWGIEHVRGRLDPTRNVIRLGIP